MSKRKDTSKVMLILLGSLGSATMLGSRVGLGSIRVRVRVGSTVAVLQTLVLVFGHNRVNTLDDSR